MLDPHSFFSLANVTFRVHYCALSMERPLLSSKAMNKWTEAFVLHLLKRTTNIKAIFSIETDHCLRASMSANVSRCSMLASPRTKTACGQVPHTSTPHQVFQLQSVFPIESRGDEETEPPFLYLPTSSPEPSLMQKNKEIKMEEKKCISKVPLKLLLA